MRNVMGRRPARVIACWLAVLGLALVGGAAAADEPSAPGSDRVGPDRVGSDRIAQASGAPGSVSSVLFHDLPEGLAIEVATFDDTDTNLAVRARFVEELEKSGYVIADGAPLELSFTSEVIQGDLRQRSGSLGRIGASTEADRGTRGSDVGVDLELNVWSSTKDSVLGGIQPQTGGGRHAQMHINALLRDRGSGQVLWQGDAFSDMVMSDERRLAGAMVKPLVGAFGRSVKNEPFQVR